MINTILKYPDQGIQKENLITKWIRNRRSIRPDECTGEKISYDLLSEILINATWAPNHKMTEPWRFIVYKDNYLKDFGHFLAEFYQSFYRSILTTEESEKKYEYLQSYPLKASCMIGIVMVHNPKLALPEWEEIAAVSCAVQNIALTCVAQGLGGYWNTTEAAIEYVRQSGLKENEKSLGVFFIGHPENKLSAGNKKRRSPIEKKITVLE